MESNASCGMSSLSTLTIYGEALCTRCALFVSVFYFFSFLGGTNINQVLIFSQRKAEALSVRSNNWIVTRGNIAPAQC